MRGLTVVEMTDISNRLNRFHQVNSSYYVSAAGLIKRLEWPTISDISLSEKVTIMYM